MRRISGAMVAACIIGLAVSGCTSSDSGGTATGDPVGTPATSVPMETSSPSPTTAPVNVRYDSVYDLRDLVQQAGMSCTSWKVVADPDGAVERAICTDEVVLATHTDAAQVARSIENVAALTTSFDLISAHIAGPNWSVNCGSEVQLCRRLRDQMGGELDVRSPE